MSELAPEGATCAQHPELAANLLCSRCGSFMCPTCERRVRPDSAAMCPACFALRDQRVVAVKAVSPTRFHTAGLLLGCASLLPIAPLILASIVVNVIALVKSEAPEARAVRWKPILGLLLSLVWPALAVVLVVLGLTRAKG